MKFIERKRYIKIFGPAQNFKKKSADSSSRMIKNFGLESEE